MDLEPVLTRKLALDALRPLPEPVAIGVSRWFELNLILAEVHVGQLPLSREQIEGALDNRPADLPPAAAAALANLRLALAWIGGVEPDGHQLGEPTVRMIHRLLARGLSENVGRYRSRPIRQEQSDEVGSGPVILPRASSVPMLMARVGAWLQATEPTPEAAWEAHYRLLRVQPFADYNHTVARLLMNLLLSLGGYPPILIHAEHAAQYHDCVEVALVRQDKVPWQRFALERLVESLDVCLVAAAPAAAAALTGPVAPVPRR